MKSFFLTGWRPRSALVAALLSMAALAQEPDPLAPLQPAVSPATEVLPDSAAAPSLIPPSMSASRLPRAVLPEHNGYAFDEPPILLRQRLIGLAHGLRLLGRVCLFSPAHSVAAEHAYAEWYGRQGSAIERMSADLERWYFGTQTELDPALRLRDVIRALGLRSDLREMTDTERDAACATFPLAISSERYDFVRLLQLTDEELAPLPPPSPSSSSPIPVAATTPVAPTPPAALDDAADPAPTH